MGQNDLNHPPGPVGAPAPAPAPRWLRAPFGGGSGASWPIGAVVEGSSEPMGKKKKNGFGVEHAFFGIIVG